MSRAMADPIHLDVAVRIGGPSAPCEQWAQVVPKVEDAPAPGGSLVVLGSVASVTSNTSRPRRGATVPVEELTLQDFEPGKFEVLAPREGDLEDTWLPVVGHREGFLVVQNEDGDDEKLSIHAVNRMLAVKKVAVKRPLTEEWSRFVAPRLAGPQEDGEEVEEDDDGEDGEVGEDEEDEEDEAEVQDSDEAAAAALRGNSTAYDFAEHLAGVVKVKLENDAHASESGGAKQKDSATLAREAHRAKLLYEPSVKNQKKRQPRKTFRRGCSNVGSITDVLGGCGTLLERVVKKDVILRGKGEGGSDHVIIRAGEMYFSAARDWNTWAPAFAGDDCAFMYNFQSWMDEQAEKRGWKTPQKVFHLFAEAPATPIRGPMRLPTPAWHGKSAATKGIYCGKYMLDEDYPEQSVTFKQLPECTQKLEAYFEARYRLRGVRAQQGLTGPVPPREIQEHAVKVLEEKLEKNAASTLYGYKFVGYDELLYKELIKVNANSGVIDVDDLGPL